MRCGNSGLRRVYGGGGAYAGFGIGALPRFSRLIDAVMLRSLPVADPGGSTGSAKGTIAAWKAVHRTGGECFRFRCTSG